MKVIIGVEDRVYGEAIINFIAAQKWESGTKFEIIHVFDREPSGEFLSEICCATAADSLEAQRKAAQELLVEIERKLLQLIPGALTEAKMINGSPKEKLLEEVETQKADLLVVGSHGRKGFDRFLLGSVSLALLSQAPCSMLVVKLPQTAETTDWHRGSGFGPAQHGRE